MCIKREAYCMGWIIFISMFCNTGYNVVNHQTRYFVKYSPFYLLLPVTTYIMSFLGKVPFLYIYCNVIISSDNKRQSKCRHIFCIPTLSSTLHVHAASLCTYTIWWIVPFLRIPGDVTLKTNKTWPRKVSIRCSVTLRPVSFISIHVAIYN